MTWTRKNCWKIPAARFCLSLSTETTTKRCVTILHLIFHSFSVYLRHENVKCTAKKGNTLYGTSVQFRCVAQIHFFYFQLNLQLPFINARALNSLLRELLFFRWCSLNSCALQRDINFSLLLSWKSTWKTLNNAIGREFLLPRFESFVQQHWDKRNGI